MEKTVAPFFVVLKSVEIVRQQMNEWTSCGVVFEGQPIDVGGINPWNFQWISLNERPVELPHPAYPCQRHRMFLYEVDNAGKKIIFAAGELSANVWGFYIPLDGKRVK